jgi:hypothetical protein
MVVGVDVCKLHSIEWSVITEMNYEENAWIVQLVVF